MPDTAPNTDRRGEASTVETQLATLTGQMSMLMQLFEKQVEKNAELEAQLAVVIAASDPEEVGADPATFEAKRKSRIVIPPPPRRAALPIPEVVDGLREIDAEPLRTALEDLKDLPDLMLDIIEIPALGERPIVVANSAIPGVPIPGVKLAKDLALYCKNRWEDNPKGSLELLRGKRDKETRELVVRGPLDDLYATVRRAA